MSKGKDRTVYRRAYGIWVNKRNDGKKATSLHTSQHDAINAARNLLERQGGGKLTVKRVDGQIHNKDIIPPGNDPNPLLEGKLDNE